MRLPVQFTRGLTEEQQKNLEHELKNSVLARQLRKWLTDEIAGKVIDEEAMSSFDITELATHVGERRGYRRVLNNLPEE
jgi:hypothetical protein